MVTYNPKSWFGLIFEFHKSDTFRTLLWTLLVIGIYSGGIVYAEVNYNKDFHSTILVHSLLGFVIGLLLVFRTNTAYDRWWEGRKQWGELVNTSRSFALKMDAFLPQEDHSNRAFISDMIVNYITAMKLHLRDTTDTTLLRGVSDNDKKLLSSSDHLPNAIAVFVHRRISNLYRSKAISEAQLIVLESDLNSFTDTIGACERIKNTPIPFSYNMFIKKFIFVYVLTLPFGLVEDYGYATIPITVFILYVLGSMELLAEEIEDPFGEDANDLPLNALCEKITENVSEILLNEKTKHIN